jgi:UDP-2,3-diacylglucosamine hydrolase
MNFLSLKPGKKVYFASDFHLGVPDLEASLAREKRLVRWLDEISQDAEAIYLLGDVFDFWFEYKHVVPKGFTRLLGMMSRISDNEIPIYFFTGNHDMWAFDYLEKEIGLKILRKPVEFEISGKKFYLGHGDGLGPGDTGYKVIKKVFANPIFQWMFARFHPNFGFSLAQYLSRKSRANSASEMQFLGDQKEWLVQFCHQILQDREIDYFIFGHRHLPIVRDLNGKSKYINLGDWMSHNSYAVFDGQEVSLQYFS